MENRLGLSNVDSEGSEELKNFLVAAAIGDLEFTSYSIESGRVGVNDTYKGKTTALSYACMRGHVALIQFLLSRGADVNYLDTMGGSPLHYAARCNAKLFG